MSLFYIYSNSIKKMNNNPVNIENEKQKRKFWKPTDNSKTYWLMKRYEEKIGLLGKAYLRAKVI